MTRRYWPSSSAQAGAGSRPAGLWTDGRMQVPCPRSMEIRQVYVREGVWTC